MSEQTEPSTDLSPEPSEFLNEIANPTPGWSQKYGGRLGVITLCGLLQQKIALQSKTIAAVRAAAIQDLLTEMSGKDLAATLNTSKTSISKSANADSWGDPQW